MGEKIILQNGLYFAPLCVTMCAKEVCGALRYACAPERRNIFMDVQQHLLDRQKWFVNLRFGTFIHFNSATFQFAEGEIADWEYGYENDGEPRRYPFDPAQWNPVGLDCAQWARTAKSAGARFGCLTTKHHEGFALWPSDCTDHCVKSAALKTDVVGEYLNAFRKEGLTAGLYFSMLDLHHGIGRKGCTPAGKELIKGQITELLTRYGEIPFLIVDGWQAPWGGPSFDEVPFEEIDALVKSLQPDCLLMNIGEQNGLAHTDVAFCENAAGQQIAPDFAGPGASCNILTKHWFWRQSDPGEELKSADWALNMMQSVNRQNVTFLLNLSPNQRGQLDDNLVARFAEIGERVAFLPDLEQLPQGWLRR